MVETLSQYGIKEEAIVWFDCESFEEPDQYLEIFEALIALTVKQMKVEHVVSSYFHQTDEVTSVEHFIVVITFLVDAKTYKMHLQCNGWFDDALVKYLNKVLDDLQSVSQRFQMIKTGDQSMVIVFVDQETARKLDNAGLIDHEYHLEKTTFQNDFDKNGLPEA